MSMVDDKGGERTFIVAVRLVEMISTSAGPDASDHPPSNAVRSRSFLQWQR
jgi:hypothetical protein